MPFIHGGIVHVTVDDGKKLGACIVPVYLAFHCALWVVELAGSDWVVALFLLINGVCVTW